MPIEGVPPDLIDPPTGCPFEPRCPYAVERRRENPPLEQTAPGHWAACWVDVTDGASRHDRSAGDAGRPDGATAGRSPHGRRERR